MFPNSASLVALALAALAAFPHVSADAAADKKAAEAALVGKLRLAPLATDRIALLNTDDQFAFDFFDPAAAATVGKGGKIITANAATFPAVIGTNSAMAAGLLEPCSMNTPHTHPRATEMQFSVNGTIRTGMITENTSRFIMTELPPGSMTIFPVGSIHFQINDGCDPILFVSSFNSEDPGVLQIAQRFLGLPPDIVGATLGDLGVEVVKGLEAQIPDNVAIGTDACLKRCGLSRPSQPTLQHQSRVSGNAFPTGTGDAYTYTYGTVEASSAPYGDNGPSTTSAAYTSYHSAMAGDAGGPTVYSGDPGYSSYMQTYTQTTSYTKATATMTHGSSTWTTVYSSYAGMPAPTYPASPLNHIIKVGANGLTYTPSNISAAVGDTVTFEFHPKNHTVTQSSFLHPCEALAETSTTGEVGFKSGFMFVAPNVTDFPTFTITVNDTKPIWGYCGQQGPPRHCADMGMVFSINAVETGPNNFAAFQALALASGNATASGYPAGSPSGYPAGYHAAGDIAAAALSDSSSGGSSKPSTALIALIAINGTLVLGLIVLGVLYFRKRRAANRVSRHKQLYTSISVSGDPLFVAPSKLSQYEDEEAHHAAAAGEDGPLTHGLTHGPYYDPHEPGSRPHSRSPSRQR